MLNNMTLVEIIFVQSKTQADFESATCLVNFFLFQARTRAYSEIPERSERNLSSAETSKLDNFPIFHFVL